MESSLIFDTEIRGYWYLVINREQRSYLFWLVRLNSMLQSHVYFSFINLKPSHSAAR